MKLSVASDALVMPKRRGAVGGFSAAVHYLLVLFHEAEAIDLLVNEKIGITDFRHSSGGALPGGFLMMLGDDTGAVTLAKQRGDSK